LEFGTEISNFQQKKINQRNVKQYESQIHKSCLFGKATYWALKPIKMVSLYEPG